MWRPMIKAHLAAVTTIAAKAHPNYPEDAFVFEERLRLYPAGCHVYANGTAISGYILSHPWRYKQPLALNTALGTIPADADTYYIHDIALLGQARGKNAAGAILRVLIDLVKAAGLTNLSLVAVNNSTAFWQKNGFEIIRDTALDAKLQSYDNAACFMRLDLATRAAPHD